MTLDQKTATLTAIFSEVLANLAFMFTDDEEEAQPTAGDVWLETAVGYHGPQSGMLRFWCTREFSLRLAVNLLGAQPSEEEGSAPAEDAVKEFMNIVCGQLITAVHGTEAVFDLTIPELRELAETPSFPADCGPHSSTLFVEGQRLHLRYEPGPAAAGHA